MIYLLTPIIKLKCLFFVLLLFLTKPYIHAQKIDSLDIMIGQMIMVGFNGTSIKDTNTLLANVKSGEVGGVIIYEKNIDKSDAINSLRKLTSKLQEYASIPLFISIDEEGGKISRLKTKYGFPSTKSAAHLGEAGHKDTTTLYTDHITHSLNLTGINVNFAPVVDVNTNPENPIIARYERSFSKDPINVGYHAYYTVQSHLNCNILPVLKHFPGHGSSKTDTHKGMADVSNYWVKEEIIPYRYLIDSGMCDAIMTAHIINSKLDSSKIPSTLSSRVINTLLKDSLNFEGIVFSDDLQMHAITKFYGFETAIKMAINAGVDVLLFSNNIQESDLYNVNIIHDHIKSLINNGDVSRETIEKSYQKIIAIKKKYFLH